MGFKPRNRISALILTLYPAWVPPFAPPPDVYRIIWHTPPFDSLSLYSFGHVPDPSQFGNNRCTIVQYSAIFPSRSDTDGMS